jgi:ADP-ribose pyrophosphatase YjhB (NUDIX family)
LASTGGNPVDGALPFHFSELLDGPQKRDEFLQQLTTGAAADAITQLAIRAVIPVAGRVLLLKCRDDDSLDGMWGLPTGAVELGETLVEAVTRIIRTETGLHVTRVRSFLGSLDYQSEGGQQVRQYGFVTQVRPTDQITLTRHGSYTWARPDEEQPVSDANQIVIAEYVAGLKPDKP